MTINSTTNEACATRTSPKDEEWGKNKENWGAGARYNGVKKRPKNSYFTTESPFSLVPSAVSSSMDVDNVIETRTEANGAVLINFYLFLQKWALAKSFVSPTFKKSARRANCRVGENDCSSI